MSCPDRYIQGDPFPFTPEWQGNIDAEYVWWINDRWEGFAGVMLLPLSMGQKVIFQDLWHTDEALHIMAEEGATWTFSSSPLAIDLLEANARIQRPLPDFRVYLCGGMKATPSAAGMDFSCDAAIARRRHWCAGCLGDNAGRGREAFHRL